MVAKQLLPLASLSTVCLHAVWAYKCHRDLSEAYDPSFFLPAFLFFSYIKTISMPMGQFFSIARDNGLCINLAKCVSLRPHLWSFEGPSIGEAGEVPLVSHMEAIKQVFP